MSEQELEEARRKLAEQERQREREISDALAQGLGKREREELERGLKHENEEK